MSDSQNSSGPYNFNPLVLHVLVSIMALFLILGLLHSVRKILKFEEPMLQTTLKSLSQNLLIAPDSPLAFEFETPHQCVIPTEIKKSHFLAWNLVVIVKSHPYRKFICLQIFLLGVYV